MSKQTSSKERPHIHDMWDAEMVEGCGNTLGYKQKWQEYPCIIAHSATHALIAFSEDKGKIIDIEGRTIDEGDPRVFCNRVETPDKEYCLALSFLGYGSPDTSAEYLFWQKKYPELLTRKVHDYNLPKGHPDRSAE